jgi:hypothetical protein
VGVATQVIKNMDGRAKWFFGVDTHGLTPVGIYVILDIEYPRVGLIKVEAFDQALVDLRASMR